MNRRTGRLCRPVLQLPTGQSAQQTCDDDPGAHGMNRGQSNTERGDDEKGSGHGMAKASRHTKPAGHGHCRQTQPANGLPGTGLEEQQPAVGRPRSKTTAADDVGRPLAVQCRLVEGVRWCWRSGGGLRPTYLSPSHLSPLPVTVSTNSLNL